MVVIEFLIVPSATFRVFYVFAVLLREQLRVVHFDVTATSAQWTAGQIVKAFPFDEMKRRAICAKECKHEMIPHLAVNGMAEIAVRGLPQNWHS
jgi:hypothetical protein